MKAAYSPRDLVSIAIGVEESGRQAYEHFERTAQDERLKAAWSLLRVQEIEHGRLFQGLLRAAELSLSEATSSAQPSPYLRAIVSSCVFSEKRLDRAVLAGIRTDAEALELAIAFEKDSIFTYITMKDHILGDPDHVLDKIVEEEKRHLILLTGLRARLQDKFPK
jgi:rubrerythrin